jgi:hypothetical protein
VNFKITEILDEHARAILARRSARINAPKASVTKKVEDKRRKPVKHRKPLRGDD